MQGAHALAIGETHPLQPAPVGKRFVAFFLDFMVIAAIWSSCSALGSV